MSKSLRIPDNTRSFSVKVLLLAAGLFTHSVAAAPLNFSKTFTPDTINVGENSTLEFTISNPPGNGPVRGISFTDNLPTNVSISSSPNLASTGCFGSINAPASGSTISFTDGGLPDGTDCVFSVSVTSNVSGTYVNTTGDLASGAGNSGSASATLTVNTAADKPLFSKAFSPDNIVFGGKSTLTFTIDNSANPAGAFNLRFNDTFPTGMTVASPSNVISTCTGGVVSAVAGSDTVSYAPLFFGDASVAANSTCSISMDVEANATGTLTNISGELTSTNQFGNITSSSGNAVAELSVTVAQISLDKEFLADPAAPGETLQLQFTIANLNRNAVATDITFTDDLDAALTGLTATGLPASDICGAGSQLTGTSVITLTGGSLGLEESCTFTVSVVIPASTATGSYTNTTGSIEASYNGNTVTGNPATDTLVVQPSPTLMKTFLDNPAGSGGATELEFTLTNTSQTGSASDIAFSDTLESIFTSASATPAAGFCGAGSTLTFTPASQFDPASLSVSGASLAAGASCVFSVTLDIAAGAPTGTYANTTSEVTAVVDGETLTGSAASDFLTVNSAPVLLKSFTDDPAVAGNMLTLEFTLIHSENASANATGISFSDDLDAVLSGLVATGLPANDVCGTGSLLDGTGTLLLTGGTLAPGESCTFSVTLQVPAAAPSGNYTNTTSMVVADVDGVSATGPAASDDLLIAGLSVSKAFTDDPAIPGGSVTLEFTLDNATGGASASNITFSDNIDATLDGLVGDGINQIDVCGTGSSLSWSGNAFFFVTGGTLAAGESCSFGVPLTLPANAESGTYANTTSTVTATIDGATVALPPATDTLTVSSDLLILSKAFTDDPVSPGGNVTLSFTIENLSTTETIDSIGFTDDLDAAAPGMASISGLQNDVCGTGSSIDGTDLVTLTGGALPPGGSCTFSISVAVPGTLDSENVVINTTSQVTGSAGGLPVNGNEAEDTLQLIFVGLSKSFGADVYAGDTVTLSFTIANQSTASGIADLAFIDDLDAVIPGLAATGLPAMDVCGTGSVIDGTSLLNLSGASLLPGGSCTFSIDLAVPLSAVAGSYLNTTSNLSQNGLSVGAPAQAMLTILEVANPDSDGDGVLDAVDVCPDTVIPESVPTVALCAGRYALVDDDGIFDRGSLQSRSCRKVLARDIANWIRWYFKKHRHHDDVEGAQPSEAKSGDFDMQSRHQRFFFHNRPYWRTFTINDTAGCSCEQIIDELGVGKGHEKFGCGIGLMKRWIRQVE